MAKRVYSDLESVIQKHAPWGLFDSEVPVEEQATKVIEFLGARISTLSSILDAAGKG